MCIAKLAVKHADALRWAAAFLADLAAVLHPQHGTFIMNLHGGSLAGPLVRLVQAASRDPMAGAGFDAASDSGSAVLRLAHLFRWGANWPR